MATGSEFGAFFRETRESLGLSLREFCRRTGFDQANVSRLERGLLPPPKSEKVLTAYAKGLKLKPKSPEWERFMALAKPAVKSRQGHGHKNWVTAKHLEDWAGTQDARNTLPQLVRRLIRATAEGTVRLEAPSGEQTQRPGWDGLVDASGDAEFVPKGISAWEMGVDKDPKKKAEGDFTKRQKKSPGVTKRHSTFVFVTPRKWQKKGEWFEEKTNLKSWKEIRVYDSASLEEWLECAPAVDIWLARQLGLYPPGLSDVDEYWKNLKALTDPSLESAIYLASRGKQFEELRKWLEGPSDTVLVENRSPAEAIDFVVAASRKAELGEGFAARTLIVETRDAWRSVAGGDAKLVLVVHPTLAIEAELVVEAVRNGHHVIVCGSPSPESQHNRIELPRVSGLELQKALEAQGVERHRAADLTTASGGSIAVLKRLTSRHPGTVHPEWSRPPHAGTVVPLLLAGSWNDTSEGDRSALEALAATEYQDVATLAERWTACADPMLTHTLSRYDLVSRDDSWALTAHAINDSDLRRFQEVALKVLGELDPACDLPINDRWKAGMMGKVRAYSSTIRTGIAESLVLLGARPPLQKSISLESRDLAAHVVRSLLNGKEWKAWASLSSELALLAEAAPDAFLSTLENDLAKRSPAVVKLFNSDSSPLFGSNPHTGLLFALEALTWDTKSLSRVCLLLARLHEIAPKTKLGNNPMQTLTQVFMPWYPQTAVPVEERVKILQLIAKKYSKAGWKLLLNLLPEPHSIVTPNNRPVFQNWALQWSAGTTRADYAFQVEASSHLVVQLAGKDPERLKDAISMFENFPPSARTKLLSQIMAIEASDLKNDDRQALAETIREKVNRHRRFAAADWAIKGEMLEELDRARIHIEPKDIIARNAWLFCDYWKLREEVAHEEKEEDADKVVEQLRTTALNEVRAEKSWQGVLELAKVAEKPDQVGQALGLLGIKGDDARVLPALLTDSRKELSEFAKGYVWTRKHRKGWKWIKKLTIDKWSDDQVLEFALALPSEREAWDLVAACGKSTEGEYWKKVQRYYFGKSAAEVSEACAMFAKIGRPFDAIRQLAMARNRSVQIESAEILAVLERGRDALSDPEQEAALDHVQYDIKVLIQELQKRVEGGKEDVDINKVASLEWTYLELLDGHPTYPKILHEWLEKKPEFFVQLLTMIFRRDDESEGEQAESSERDSLRAMQVYRLLASWQRVPGSRMDGSVDADALRTWVKSVQTLADHEGRREMGDSRIGNVFAFSLPEADGSWPCIPVRDAIEEFGSEALMNGFEVGVFNRRGAYWKGPEEGGDQERSLAQGYFAWAEASRIEWPKTAASLRRIGERYEVGARREDAEAEPP